MLNRSYPLSFLRRPKPSQNFRRHSREDGNDGSVASLSLVTIYDNVRPWERKKPHQLGFTLLEIMLVMVLLGLATSAILPSLMPKDSGALLKQEVRRLVMLTQSAREQALLKGQDIGMQKTSDGYQFLAYQKGQWKSVTNNRLLPSTELNSAIKLTILPGESVWRDSLDLETDKGFSFDSNESESDENRERTPDIYFWASGENSPAELQLSSTSNPKLFLSVRIVESGDIALDSEGQQ